MRNIIENIGSKKELADFLRLLADDFYNSSDEWQNGSIPDFIGAIAAYIEDADDITEDDINVKMFARLLYMGKIYE